MLTFNKVKKKLLKAFEEEEGIGYFADNGDYDENLPYGVEEVVCIGGHEGGGEHAERVWHFTDPKNAEDPGVFIKMTGSYASYNGTEWDEGSLVQVFPKKRVVTKYETRAEINEQKSQKEKASD